MARGGGENLQVIKSIIVVPDSRTIIPLKRQYSQFESGLSVRGGVSVVSVASVLGDLRGAPVGLVAVGDGVRRALSLAENSPRVAKIALVNSGITAEGDLIGQRQEDPVEILAISSGEMPYVVGRRNFEHLGGFGFDKEKIGAAIIDPEKQKEIIIFMGLEPRSV